LKSLGKDIGRYSRHYGEEKALIKENDYTIYLDLWNYILYELSYLLPHLLGRCPHKTKL